MQTADLEMSQPATLSNLVRAGLRVASQVTSRVGASREGCGQIAQRARPTLTAFRRHTISIGIYMMLLSSFTVVSIQKYSSKAA